MFNIELEGDIDKLVENIEEDFLEFIEYILSSELNTILDRYKNNLISGKYWNFTNKPDMIYSLENIDKVVWVNPLEILDHIEIYVIDTEIKVGSENNVIHEVSGMSVDEILHKSEYGILYLDIPASNVFYYTLNEVFLEFQNSRNEEYKVFEKNINKKYKL